MAALSAQKERKAVSTAESPIAGDSTDA